MSVFPLSHKEGEAMEQKIYPNLPLKEPYSQPLLIPHSILQNFTAGVGKGYAEKSKDLE